MSYNMDLTKLSLSQYRELLKNQNLLPGRRGLLENIDFNFDLIEDHEITNVAELKNQLSTNQRLSQFSKGVGINEEYLIILRREIGSLEQKPVPLSSFPGLDQGLISQLHQQGIDNSREYFERSSSNKDELNSLCDLVRINGVGPAAAKAFYLAGYCSVAEISQADAEKLLSDVTKVNEATNLYKAKLGKKDIQFCIDIAVLLVRFENCA